MSSVTLVLTFEDDCWRAHGGELDVAHRDLRGLESLLAARLAGEAPVDVHFAFDMRALPRWLHQYQAHYMNYTLHVRRRSVSA